MKALLIILAKIILTCLVLAIVGLYFALRPIRIYSSVTPKNFNLTYQDVSFYTKDKIKLVGWFIPAVKPNAKTIILLHGYPADKGDILASRLFLHEKYNLLFFDFRYFGKSEGSYSTFGQNEVMDLLAAIDYLHAKGINEVGVWGLSMGAAVALLTAPHTAAIKAIVAESSYARLDWMALEYYKLPILRYLLAEFSRLWGILFLNIDVKNVSPARESEKVQIPILLIHSKSDTVIPFSHASLLAQSLSKNPNLKIIFTEDRRHGELMQDYQIEIGGFFAKYLQ